MNSVVESEDARSEKKSCPAETDRLK